MLTELMTGDIIIARVKPTQPRMQRSTDFALKTERLGPLPLINHFIERIGLEALLEQHVPTTDGRCAVAHARALGVLLRSIVVEREPIYRQQETVHGFASGLYGLSAEQLEHLSDDRLGRALDHLFQADRAALLTAVIVAVGRRFELQFQRLHNDSTSIAFCGQYRDQRPHRSGRRTPAITYGYSKDHRPDLKQLLFILTTDADGGIPVQFRAADGNTNDSVTHIETWNTLRGVAGRSDFLYVADSKLCSFDNLDYISRAGGRFVTVMPRSRQEDGHFRKWVQTQTPEWELVWDRPHPRYHDGPRDRWSVYRDPLGSREGWSLVWVWSTVLTLHQQNRRHRNLAAATEALTSLRQRVLSARARLRGASRIDLAVEEILERYHMRRYLKVKRTVRQEHTFKQARRGRPGADTAYRRITRRRYDLEWTVDATAIAYDEKSDGMYPLLSNDRNLTPAQVLEAHKGQPAIEKRFEQIKTVHEIAPVFLKNPHRIEALFTLYFLALLVQALIERELRLAMKRERLKELPLYPEQRSCKRPTTEQILRLFSLAERHTLFRRGRIAQVFHAELTELQHQVLHLLGVPEDAFRG
jgi:transposase